MRARIGHALGDRSLLVALVALALILALLCALPWLPAPRSLRAMASAETPPMRVAVADLRGHALVVLDTATAAVRRVALPGGPHELLRLDDGRIVVSLEQSSRLAVVDLDVEPARVDRVELGGLPHGLARHGDTLYVTDRDRDALRRFDITAGDVAGWRELEPLQAGSWPHSVVALPDGTLAVAVARDSTLRMGEHVLTVSELPETVTAAPLSGDVATAGALGGVLQVFDAAGRPRWSAQVGGRPVRALFAPDGVTVAVALSAARAIALVSADGAHRAVSVGGAPDGLAFDAGGRFLFVGDLALGYVSMIDVHAGVVRARFHTGESAGALIVIAGEPSEPALRP